MKVLTTLLAFWRIQGIVAECRAEEYYGKGIAICSGEDLTRIPEGLNKTLKILDLSNNRIKDIDDDALKNLTQIKEINLSYNNITELNAALFTDLNRLEEIDLSYNMLVNLPKEIFINNLKLKRCYLKNNFISIPWREPILRSTSLKYLDLSFCNITSLSIDAFRELPNLEELNLMGNCISELECSILNPLKRLKTLHVDCYSCSSSVLQNQCNDLQHRFISCHRSDTVTEEEAFVPLMHLSVISAITCSCLIITLFFCIKRWRYKRTTSVRTSDPETIRALLLRPLPQPPLPNDGYEVPINPWYMNGGTVHVSYICKCKGSVYSSIPSTDGQCTRQIFTRSNTHLNEDSTPFLVPERLLERRMPSHLSELSSEYEPNELDDKLLNFDQSLLKNSSGNVAATNSLSLHTSSMTSEISLHSISARRSHSSRTSNPISVHVKNTDSKKVFTSTAFVLLGDDKRV